jgi:hypothetical protein
MSRPTAIAQNAASTGRMPPSRLRPTNLDETLLAAQDEDDLPLGVVMLQRRQKEEAEERRRKLIQAEKAERERRVREEEEKRRRYAGEVLAARARREQDRTGKPGAALRDAWLEGDAEALPPPSRPYASNHPRSSSNPDLSLHVPRPEQSRRQTTDSSAGSVTSSTTTTPTVGPKRQDTLRQHSAPVVPSPWTGFPSGGGMSGGSEYDAASMYSGSLRVPKTAPIVPMNYGIVMMPPVPDPISMAMFEQGLLRPWAMNSMGNGSTGNLTPPRAPFGFASSGDSSGSLTPPRFPNSRPSSWGSSNEDVRMTMQRSSSGVAIGSNGLSVRPDSGAYSSGGSAENHDWRKSRSGMLSGGVNMDQNRSSSSSKSPVDARRPTLAAGNVPSSSTSHTLKSLRSDGNLNAHSSGTDSRHRNQPSSSTTRTAPQQPPSSFNMQNRSRSDGQSRTKTTPAPQNPYGLSPPTSQGYSSNPNSLSAKSGSAIRSSMLSMSRSTDEVHRTGLNGNSMGSQQNPPKHAHSKSGGQPIQQRKSRLMFG